MGALNAINMWPADIYVNVSKKGRTLDFSNRGDLTPRFRVYGKNKGPWTERITLYHHDYKWSERHSNKEKFNTLKYNDGSHAARIAQAYAKLCDLVH